MSSMSRLLQDNNIIFVGKFHGNPVVPVVISDQCQISPHHMNRFMIYRS